MYDTKNAALARTGIQLVEKPHLEDGRGDLQNIHLPGVVPLFLRGGMRG
jgi:hypothetical protein